VPKLRRLNLRAGFISRKEYNLPEMQFPLYRAGKYEEALKVFEEIISFDPTDSSARAIIDELSTHKK
jgi:hypothetical protein